jgi:hypothetical protein
MSGGMRDSPRGLIFENSEIWTHDEKPKLRYPHETGAHQRYSQRDPINKQKKMRKDREHNGKITPIIKMKKSQLIEMDHINETTTQNSEKIYQKVNMKSVVINIGTSCNERKWMSSNIGNQFYWCVVRNSEKLKNFKISRSQRLFQSSNLKKDSSILFR